MQPVDVPGALSGVVRDFHHVAIVVHEIASARVAWEGALGLPAGEVEHVPEQGVDVLVLHAGGQRIELVQPAHPESPVLGFLARRGEGMHHLAFRVDDMEAALSELKRRGVRLVDEFAKAGAHGSRVAWVHPKATNGVLIELVQEMEAHR
jgi:methylmalonyl-CoA/ethylmalonyl-CoA epimerase